MADRFDAYTTPEDSFPTKSGDRLIADSIGYRIEVASRGVSDAKAYARVSAGAAAMRSRLEKVSAAFHVIGPRAQEILCRIAERLARGAKQYGGDFDDKPRDWNAEALEEMLDGCVYLTMAAMKQEEAKAADAQRAAAANRGPKAEYHIQAGDVGESRAEFPPLQDAGRLDPRDGGA